MIEYLQTEHAIMISNEGIEKKLEMIANLKNFVIVSTNDLDVKRILLNSHRQNFPNLEACLRFF